MGNYNEHINEYDEYEIVDDIDNDLDYGYDDSDIEDDPDTEDDFEQDDFGINLNDPDKFGIMTITLYGEEIEQLTIVLSFALKFLLTLDDEDLESEGVSSVIDFISEMMDGIEESLTSLNNQDEYLY